VDTSGRYKRQIPAVTTEASKKKVETSGETPQPSKKKVKASDFKGKESSYGWKYKVQASDTIYQTNSSGFSGGFGDSGGDSGGSESTSKQEEGGNKRFGMRHQHQARRRWKQVIQNKGYSYRYGFANRD
jgi:hypothetical protein